MQQSNTFAMSGKNALYGTTNKEYGSGKLRHNDSLGPGWNPSREVRS